MKWNENKKNDIMDILFKNNILIKLYNNIILK